ncbi:MAG: PAS domain S-box protein [Capsulimonadales bacterium]|nr:PAS domain S-box protein [Capsulimonadales bacterium]
MDPILSIGLSIVTAVAGGAAGAFYKGKAQSDEYNKKLELLKRENATLVDKGSRSGAEDTTRLRQQEEEISRLKQRETEREAELKRLSAEAEEKANQVRTLTLRVDELDAAVRTAEETARQVREEAQNLEARTRDISVEAATAVELTDARKAAEDAELRAMQAEEELAALRTQLTTAEATLTEATAARNAADTALAAAQTELESIRAERAGAQAELARLQSELAEVRTQLTAAETEIARINAELTRVQSERETLEKDQDARFQRLQEFAERQVGKLQEENRSLKESAGTRSTGSAAEENFHALTAIAPDGIFEADTAGKWTFVSDAWTKLTGLAAAKCKESGWLEAVFEADRVEVAEKWQKAVQERQAFHHTFRINNAAGTLRLISIKARPVRGTGNYLGLIEDITELRRIEEGLKSANACLQSVVEAATEGIVVLDRKGNITSWNRAASDMFGYSRDEANGRNITALLVADDRPTLKKGLDAAAKQVANNEPQVMEVLALCKDGRSLPIEISVAAWNSGDMDGGIYYTATMRDVTERRQAEDFRRAKDAAEESNRAKSQFLANMSHELRTPLNAIIGFSEILHDRTFGDLTPKQDRYVGNILQSGRHLLQLINDILDISKVEAGHMQLEYVAFPVAVAVRNIENMVKVLLSKKNITLEVDIPGDLPVIIADQAKFKQIIYNLVSNAIKFTPDGGKVTITARATDENRTLQVAVKDTGIGIKPEDQERVFREFEQVDNSYARQQQGTGLGLALVRKFVALHGGKITVFSEGEGKGTTFTFAIPFGPSEAKPSAEPTAPTPASAPAATVVVPTLPGGEKPVVLVVEDDQNASELLTHHLQMAGYEVRRTGSGPEAIALANEARPAVITLDVQLAEGDGWTVLETLKKTDATRNIPVFIVSIIEDRDRALALGVVDTFTKPIVKERLLEAIGRSIEERSGDRAEADAGTGSASAPAKSETAGKVAAGNNSGNNQGKRNGRSRG